MKKLSIKSQLIIFLVIFSLYIWALNKEAAFLRSLSLAVIAAAILESGINFFRNRQLLVTESSVITGLITGLVLSSDQVWWKLFAASFFAISSKHLLRFKGRHIFNPAAFGIFLSMILLGAETQWNGTYIWYILLPFGLYFIIKIHKFEVLAGYALAALGLFTIQALLKEGAGANIFGYFSYFYIFIMVIEPKTTPARGIGKFIFGGAVAALVFVLTELGVKFDAELAGLLLANICTPLLNKIPLGRRS